MRQIRRHFQKTSVGFCGGISHEVIGVVVGPSPASGDADCFSVHAEGEKRIPGFTEQARGPVTYLAIGVSAEGSSPVLEQFVIKLELPT